MHGSINRIDSKFTDKVLFFSLWKTLEDISSSQERVEVVKEGDIIYQVMPRYRGIG